MATLSKSVVQLLTFMEQVDRYCVNDLFGVLRGWILAIRKQDDVW